MSRKILTPSETNTKINSMRFIQSKKIEEILKLRELIKSCTPAEALGYNHHIDSLTQEHDEIALKIDELSQTFTSKEFPKIQVFHPLSYQDLLNLPPKEWIVDQFFGLGDLGMIYGPPGCGKTFIVIDLIVHMCTAAQWAGRFNVNRPLNVAYCAGEGVSALPSRFVSALKYHEVSNLTNFTFFKSVPQFFNKDPSESETILNFILEWKKRQHMKEAEALDVLVIDTLHTAIAGADENSSQDMGLVLQACRLAAQQLGCTVLLVHHTNKDGETERGSSSLRGAMDFMVKIKKPEKGKGNDATMICEKLKDGEMWRDQGFYLSKVEDTASVRVAWDDPNEALLSYANSQEGDRERLIKAMKQQNGNGLTVPALSEVIGQNKNHTTRLLNELVEKKRCDRKLQDSTKISSNRNPWVYFILSF